MHRRTNKRYSVLFYSIVQQGAAMKQKIGETMKPGWSPQTATTTRLRLLIGCCKEQSDVATSSPTAWKPAPQLEILEGGSMLP